MSGTFSIENTIERMKRLSSDKDASLSIHMGASDGLIKEFEQKLKIRVPDDFKKLYYFSNGTSEDSNLFRIIPLEEIMENSERKDHQMGPGEIDFAEYMIYCDVWTLSVDKSDHNSYIIHNWGAGNRTDYTRSLAEFLERYLDGGVYDGIYEWENEIKRSKRFF